MSASNASKVMRRSWLFPYLPREVVLVHEHILQTPHLQAVNVAKLTLPIEVLSAVLALVDELVGELPKQFCALS